jgi:hypothetical protein
MAKGYWVAHVDVNDGEDYKAYGRQGRAAAQIRRKFLIGGGKFEGKEGIPALVTSCSNLRPIRRRSAATTRLNISAHSHCARPIRPPNLIVIEGYDDA